MLDLPHHSVGFRFTSDLSLLTLKGVGLHYVDSHEYSWDNHFRKDEHCLIQYCIDGEGALDMDGIHLKLCPGDAFIIEIPGNSHYYLPKHADHWEFVYFEFSKECLSLIWKIYRSTGPVLPVTEESGLLEQMLAIYQKALNNQLETFFENAKLAYQFWMDLTSYAVALSSRELSKIDLAKAYIDQNYYREDLNLDLVAENAGMSKYYMCKEFHKKYGVSPGKYLKELRISQACRLLSVNTDYTMQEIAQMVGYSNNNYFGKVFKASKGITPDKFKKQSSQYDFVRAVYETPRHIFIPREPAESDKAPD